VIALAGRQAKVQWVDVQIPEHVSFSCNCAKPGTVTPSSASKRSPEAQAKPGKIWTVVQQAPLPVYFLFSPIDALTACTVLTAIHPNTTKPTIFLTSVTMLTTDSEA